MGDEVALAENAVAPEQLEMQDQDNSLRGILSRTNKVYIDQKFDMIEAATMGMCERPNKFKIMDDEKNHILSAREETSCMARCCCAPYQNGMVFVTSAKDEQEVLLTLERKGCDFPMPVRCPGLCCACMDMFKDNITMYAGKVEGKAGSIEAAPEPIAMVEQQTFGGGLWPKLNVRKGDDVTHTIEGPCCFGGCSELCIPATYRMISTKSDAEVATLEHMTPKDPAAACQEMVSDADHFNVEFTSSTSPDDRIIALGSSILIDYMFFEMDNGMIQCKSLTSLDITCFIIHCCGCFWPCKIHCDLAGDSGGGDSGATE
eukprot:TRINITY_DN82291_c0_g1_i1.p1 TRINITY_DN82291_c0_g1~~TRINITY_DN82291_c0_g1_i1.p1  ORF type:complete len:317 (+),score=83.67 TRINITY_DN82291_c0_g1_i1:74-1024(+)